MWSYKRKAVFGMPGYVEIDLGVCSDGHRLGKGVNALNCWAGDYHAVNGVARLRQFRIKGFLDRLRH